MPRNVLKTFKSIEANRNVSMLILLAWCQPPKKLIEIVLLFGERNRAAVKEAPPIVWPREKKKHGEFSVGREDKTVESNKKGKDRRRADIRNRFEIDPFRDRTRRHRSSTRSSAENSNSLGRAPSSVLVRWRFEAERREIFAVRSIDKLERDCRRGTIACGSFLSDREIDELRLTSRKSQFSSS